jgi:hypothetical protein
MPLKLTSSATEFEGLAQQSVMAEVLGHHDVTSGGGHHLRQIGSKVSKDPVCSSGSIATSSPIASAPRIAASEPEPHAACDKVKGVEWVHPTLVPLKIVGPDKLGWRQADVHGTTATMHTIEGQDETFGDETASLLAPTSSTALAMYAAATADKQLQPSSSDDSWHASLQSGPCPCEHHTERQSATVAITRQGERAGREDSSRSSPCLNDKKAAFPSLSAVLPDHGTHPFAVKAGRLTEKLESISRKPFWSPSQATSARSSAAHELSTEYASTARPEAYFTASRVSNSISDANKSYDACSSDGTCDVELQPFYSVLDDMHISDDSNEGISHMTPRSSLPRPPLLRRDVEGWRLAASQGLHGHSSSTSVCLLGFLGYPFPDAAVKDILPDSM